jgi:hypothetical protein
MRGFGVNEIIDLGPAPQAGSVSFGPNKLPPGLPQAAYAPQGNVETMICGGPGGCRSVPGPLPQPNPAPIVQSSGASMAPPGFQPVPLAPISRGIDSALYQPGGPFGGGTIEWKGQTLRLGIDVDAKNPWYNGQPNFLYHTSDGPVAFPGGRSGGLPGMPVPSPLIVDSGQPMPISPPMSPPMIPSPGRVDYSMPLPKQNLLPSETMFTSAPNATALYSADSFVLPPAGASPAAITQQKIPLWMWVAGGAMLAILWRSR